MLKIHILNWCDTFFYRTEGLGLWGWLFKALRVWMLLWSVRSAFRCFRDVTVAGWTSWNAGSSTLQALATWLMNSGLVSILSWGKISAHKNILGWTTTKNLFFLPNCLFFQEMRRYMNLPTLQLSMSWGLTWAWVQRELMLSMTALRLGRWSRSTNLLLANTKERQVRFRGLKYSL